MTHWIFKKRYRGMIKLGFLFVLGAMTLLFFNFEAAFFFVTFAAFVLFKITAKYPAQAALVFLLIVPLLQALDRNAQAEQVAVYAYFLLVITVALQIIALKRTPNVSKNEKNF